MIKKPIRHSCRAIMAFVISDQPRLQGHIAYEHVAPIDLVSNVMQMYRSWGLPSEPLVEYLNSAPVTDPLQDRLNQIETKLDRILAMAGSARPL